MQRMLMGLWIALCAGVVILGYIRLAPASPDKWHQPLTFAASADTAGRAMRVIQDPAPETFVRLDAIIRATPRTRVVFGSLMEGRITYVTRSAAIGFPDYTTIEEVDGQIRLMSRLRFGRSDFGVNAARADAWIKALQGG